MSDNPMYVLTGRDSGIHIVNLRISDFNGGRVPKENEKFLWNGKIWLTKRVTEYKDMGVIHIEVFMYNDNPDLGKQQ